MFELESEVKQEIKKEELNRLIKQIEIADAVFYGMAAIQTKKGNSMFKRWRDRIMTRIKLLTGKKVITVWDKMTKRSNKI